MKYRQLFPSPLAGARKLALSTSMGSSALPKRLGNRGVPQRGVTTGLGPANPTAVWGRPSTIVWIKPSSL
ncbi:hypothetical protein AAFF_G00174380 [Aldrovandia affinis]|uniref:Uncharacterized protein n=1 Tax=Aldrovandia affinis TaxID=143900 RepID=A0AAD7RL75_9TELE|nr:hypothetical protein AAFF_G00174380 [Aldrovandia affinis]